MAYAQRGLNVPVTTNPAVPPFHLHIPIQLCGGNSVGLLKMDAQGHECAIVRGMGRLVEHIKVIKTEIANLWLSGHQNCSDSILFNLLQTHGRRIEDEHGVVLTEPKVLDVYDVIVS